VPGAWIGFSNDLDCRHPAVTVEWQHPELVGCDALNDDVMEFPGIFVKS
jgi:hypothetical protein